MPAPFVDQEFTFDNPDGSQVRVRGSGNQFAAVFETLDGYTVVRDPVSDFYYYATVSADGSTLTPTGHRVGAADPRGLGLDKHVRMNPAASRRRRAATRSDAGLNRWEVRRQERRTARDAGATSVVQPHVVPRGELVGLCLMVDFPDVRGTMTRQQVEDFCNKPGYSEFGNNGSVFDYFHDVSEGRVRYTNIVTDYYTAKRNRAHYTDERKTFGRRARELALETLQHLKDRGFDFEQLSADSSQTIYALNVFYAGDIVNRYQHGLWPHQGHLATPFLIAPPRPFPSAPPPASTAQLFDFQITNMGDELTLRTFCHENGHMLFDWPDLYDTDTGRTAGGGSYCLMGSAASEKNPVQVCAYLKSAAGWTSSVRTFVNGDVETLQAGVNDFLIHRKNSTEYFLIENRDSAGRDELLPSHGLAIWHVDENGSNDHDQLTRDKHFEAALEQADGKFDLEQGTNAGDGNDLYGRTAFEFGDLTVPSSKWWDGSPSKLDITFVSPPGQAVTVTTKGVTRFVMADFGVDSGWQVDKHPRLLADLTGDGRLDVVGFGNAGVWISLIAANRSFGQPKLVVADFGYDAGGWRVEDHVRFAADITGNKRADIVGFGRDGVMVAFNNPDGTFTLSPNVAVADFGVDAGGWHVDRHPRTLAVLANRGGNDAVDIIGFGNHGVWISFNNGDGTFQTPELAIADFGYDAGGWRMDRHVRLLADLTGDGRDDIVGFGRDGVMVALNNGDGAFPVATFAIAEFGSSAGWRVDRHPRFVAPLVKRPNDLTVGDIVGFFNDGVHVALNNGDGTFQRSQPVLNFFGHAHGWRVQRHPRFVTDLTGDGCADIVGFFEDGVWVAFNNGDGTFRDPERVIDNFGIGAGGWHIEMHPRFVADLSGGGAADIIGFGNAGVFTSINNGTGRF